MRLLFYVLLVNIFFWVGITVCTFTDPPSVAFIAYFIYAMLGLNIVGLIQTIGAEKQETSDD